MDLRSGCLVGTKGSNPLLTPSGSEFEMLPLKAIFLISALVSISRMKLSRTLAYNSTPNYSRLYHRLFHGMRILEIVLFIFNIPIVITWPKIKSSVPESRNSWCNAIPKFYKKLSRVSTLWIYIWMIFCVGVSHPFVSWLHIKWLYGYFGDKTLRRFNAWNDQILFWKSLYKI